MHICRILGLDLYGGMAYTVFMNKQVDPDVDFPKEDPFDLGALPDDNENFSKYWNKNKKEIDELLSLKIK